MALRITCDDFGMHPSIDNGILDLLNKGLKTSVSILPTGTSFQSAIKGLKECQISTVGIHLSLCSEYKEAPLFPVTGQHPRFVDVDLWSPKPKNMELHKKELLAQIHKVQDAGLKISHLDGHMFFYEPSIGGPDLYLFCVELASKLGVPLRRRDQCDIEDQEEVVMIWEGYDTIESRTDFYDHFFNQKHFLTKNIELIIHPGKPLNQLRLFTTKPERRYGDYQYFAALKNLRSIGETV